MHNQCQKPHSRTNLTGRWGGGFLLYILKSKTLCGKRKSVQTVGRRGHGSTGSTVQQFHGPLDPGTPSLPRKPRITAGLAVQPHCQSSLQSHTATEPSPAACQQSVQSACGRCGRLTTLYISALQGGGSTVAGPTSQFGWSLPSASVLQGWAGLFLFFICLLPDSGGSGWGVSHRRKIPKGTKGEERRGKRTRRVEQKKREHGQFKVRSALPWFNFNLEPILAM
jgi:hypothetical protein